MPTIKAGILPRIANIPPVTVDRKTFRIKRENNDANDGNNNNNSRNNTTNNNGGVFGKMLDWCHMAEQVMKTMEWLPNGYEFDEKTNIIDYARPLYRCCYCLRYRNATGFGNHENWCQLQAALEEYNKVRGIRKEFTLASQQANANDSNNNSNNNNNNNNSSNNNNNNSNENVSGMGTMQETDDAPPQIDSNKFCVCLFTCLHTFFCCFVLFWIRLLVCLFVFVFVFVLFVGICIVLFMICMK